MKLSELYTELKLDGFGQYIAEIEKVKRANQDYEVAASRAMIRAGQAVQANIESLRRIRAGGTNVPGLAPLTAETAYLQPQIKSLHDYRAAAKLAADAGGEMEMRFVGGQVATMGLARAMNALGVEGGNQLLVLNQLSRGTQLLTADLGTLIASAGLLGKLGIVGVAGASFYGGYKLGGALHEALFMRDLRKEEEDAVANIARGEARLAENAERRAEAERKITEERRAQADAWLEEMRSIRKGWESPGVSARGEYYAANQEMRGMLGLKREDEYEGYANLREQLKQFRTELAPPSAEDRVRAPYAEARENLKTYVQRLRSGGLLSPGAEGLAERQEQIIELSKLINDADMRAVDKWQRRQDLEMEISEDRTRLSRLQRPRGADVIRGGITDIMGFINTIQAAAASQKTDFEQRMLDYEQKRLELETKIEANTAALSAVGE
jgi:hypothetical protein